jgi:hypothetical protein
VSIFLPVHTVNSVQTLKAFSPAVDDGTAAAGGGPAFLTAKGGPKHGAVKRGFLLRQIECLSNVKVTLGGDAPSLSATFVCPPLHETTTAITKTNEIVKSILIRLYSRQFRCAALLLRGFRQLVQVNWPGVEGGPENPTDKAILQYLAQIHKMVETKPVPL